MRIWSFHPKYLDTKGLVALWREALLAQHVLEGKTKAYKNHPQLERFKLQKDPLGAMNTYLYFVYKEAVSRAYNFSQEKIGQQDKGVCIDVNNGQVFFEFEHLMKKLHIRDQEMYKKNLFVKQIELHPLFTKVDGDIELWEKV